MSDFRPSGTTDIPPQVTELRLSAFRGVRGLRLPLEGLTLLTGPSGSGKSTVIEAYEALARLAVGHTLHQVFATAPGGPAAYVPRQARPDELGRRGFRLGCTVVGPVGEVRLDLAVQALPSLRVVGERLTDGSRVLLGTALRDPSRSVVEAAWHTAGVNAVTRAPLPDDQLCTPLLPLRVAGTTRGQRDVLAAAEQVVRALRATFTCDPVPESMRAPIAVGDGLLRGGCDNLAAVLRRTSEENPRRHAALVEAVRAGCSGGEVRGLWTEEGEGAERGLLRALVDRGEAGTTPLDWLAEGELRYAALALVLLAGHDVLRTPAVPQPAAPARAEGPALTVLADGVDRGLDDRQARELLTLASRVCARGRVRLLGTVTGPERVAKIAGANVARLSGGEADVSRPRTSVDPPAHEDATRPGLTTPGDTPGA